MHHPCNGRTALTSLNVKREIKNSGIFHDTKNNYISSIGSFSWKATVSCIVNRFICTGIQGTKKWNFNIFQWKWMVRRCGWKWYVTGRYAHRPLFIIRADSSVTVCRRYRWRGALVRDWLSGWTVGKGRRGRRGGGLYERMMRCRGTWVRRRRRI